MAMVNSEEAPYETSPKQVLTHVALCACGLEHRQTTARLLIGLPEEYVHGHTLPTMLTQVMTLSGSTIIGVTSAAEGRLIVLASA